MENIDPNNLNITVDKDTGLTAEDVRSAFQSVAEPEMVNIVTGEKLKFSSASAKIHNAPDPNATYAGTSADELKDLVALLENPSLIDKAICNRALVLVKKDMSCMMVYI